MNPSAGLIPPREISPEEFAWIRGFLHQHTGIELKPGKEHMVMGRLDRRLRYHGLTGYAQYIARLADGSDPEEVRQAIDLLTTNETYFFRESAHFELLTAVLRSASPPAVGPLRLWSAACSSGEEPWSMAMTAADALPADRRRWELVATDISSRVLEVAQGGMYPIEAAAKIPPHLLRRFCLRGRDRYEGFLAVAPQLRERVEFRHANLLRIPGDLGRFDVVFLRNVMIYFGLETKRDLVARVESMLRPGGYLVVSHSETLNGLGTALRMVSPSVYRAAGGGDG